MAVKRAEKNSMDSAMNNVQVEVPDLENTPVAEEVQIEETTPVVETPAMPSDNKENLAPTEETTPFEDDTPVEPETFIDPDPLPEEPPVPKMQISTDPDTAPAPGGVTVDPESLKVKEDNIPTPPEARVRIRMRVDHHCVIAMERYDFKAGQTYLVPPNVKRIMNKQGYLAPL